MQDNVIPFPRSASVDIVCNRATVLTLSDQIAEIVSAHLKAAGEIQDINIFEVLEALARQAELMIVHAETEFDGVAGWFDDARAFHHADLVDERDALRQQILEREGDAP